MSKEVGFSLDIAVQVFRKKTQNRTEFYLSVSDIQLLEHCTTEGEKNQHDKYIKYIFVCFVFSFCLSLFLFFFFVFSFFACFVLFVLHLSFLFSLSLFCICLFCFCFLCLFVCLFVLHVYFSQI